MDVFDKKTRKPKIPKSDINTPFLHNLISDDGEPWKPIVTSSVSTCSNRRECHGPCEMTLKTDDLCHSRRCTLENITAQWPWIPSLQHWLWWYLHLSVKFSRGTLATINKPADLRAETDLSVNIPAATLDLNLFIVLSGFSGRTALKALPLFQPFYRGIKVFVDILRLMPHFRRL